MPFYELVCIARSNLVKVSILLQIIIFTSRIMPFTRFYRITCKIYSRPQPCKFSTGVVLFEVSKIGEAESFPTELRDISNTLTQDSMYSLSQSVLAFKTT
jgi:hypothetical protein